MACTVLADQMPPPIATKEDLAASKAWLERVDKEAAKQSPQLFAYIRCLEGAHQTVEIINNKDRFLLDIFTTPGAAAAPSRDEQELMRQTTHVYYSVLQFVLRKLYPMCLVDEDGEPVTDSAAADADAAAAHPPAGTGTATGTVCFARLGDAPRVAHMLSIPVFHTSILTVAAMLVTSIRGDPTCPANSRPCIGTPERFLDIARRAGFETNMMALWNAGRWYQMLWDCLPAARPNSDPCAEPPSALIPPLPGGYCIARLMRLVEEVGALREGSVIYSILAEGAGRAFTTGDEDLLNRFLKVYSRRAVDRAHRMAHVLLEKPEAYAAANAKTRTSAAASAPAEPPLPPNSLPLLCARLMDAVLAEHLQLAFNQHVSALAACCVYAVAEAKGCPIPFKDIVHRVCAALPDHHPDLLNSRVEVKAATAACPAAACPAAASPAAASPAAACPAAASPAAACPAAASPAAPSPAAASPAAACPAAACPAAPSPAAASPALGPVRGRVGVLTLAKVTAAAREAAVQAREVAQAGGAAEMGEVSVFYKRVFLPAAEGLIRSTVREHAAELARGAVTPRGAAAPLPPPAAPPAATAAARPATAAGGRWSQVSNMEVDDVSTPPPVASTGAVVGSPVAGKKTPAPAPSPAGGAGTAAGEDSAAAAGGGRDAADQEFSFAVTPKPPQQQQQQTSWRSGPPGVTPMGSGRVPRAAAATAVAGPRQHMSIASKFPEAEAEEQEQEGAGEWGRSPALAGAGAGAHSGAGGRVVGGRSPLGSVKRPAAVLQASLCNPNSATVVVAAAVGEGYKDGATGAKKGKGAGKEGVVGAAGGGGGFAGVVPGGAENRGMPQGYEFAEGEQGAGASGVVGAAQEPHQRQRRPLRSQYR